MGIDPHTLYTGAPACLVKTLFGMGRDDGEENEEQSVAWAEGDKESTKTTIPTGTTVL